MSYIAAHIAQYQCVTLEEHAAVFLAEYIISIDPDTAFNDRPYEIQLIIGACDAAAFAMKAARAHATNDGIHCRLCGRDVGHVSADNMAADTTGRSMEVTGNELFTPEMAAEQLGLSTPRIRQLCEDPGSTLGTTYGKHGAVWVITEDEIIDEQERRQDGE